MDGQNARLKYLWLYLFGDGGSNIYTFFCVLRETLANNKLYRMKPCLTVDSVNSSLWMAREESRRCGV